MKSRTVEKARAVEVVRLSLFCGVALACARATVAPTLLAKAKLRGRC
jgi:hypothetical protein